MGATIRLEWLLDSKGYDLEQDQPPALQPPATRAYGKRRSVRAGDDTIAGQGALTRGAYIVPRGGTVEPYPLEGTEDRVSFALMNIPATPEGALDFVNEWGMPHSHGRTYVSEILDVRNSMQTVVLHAIKSNWPKLERIMPEKGIGRLSVRFGRLRGDSSPRVFLQPDSLFSFCWLELMQILAGGVAIRACLNCGAFFSIGIERGTRSTRQYCSDRCRVAMHRKAKRDL